ncbi:putative cytochrome p450 protein [Naviculisporaceae sp. PSN 640]
MLGLMRHKMGYYVKLSEKNRLPIYSLTTFGGKVYVVNSPDVAAAVFRNTKDLSFAQMAAQVVSRVSLSSPEGTQTMLENANGRQGSDKGYTPEGFKLLHAALAPGPGLQEMVTVANAQVAANLEWLEPEPGESSRGVLLYESMQHFIVQATSAAVYGPLNPFKQPDVEKAFWDFEKNFTTLLVNVAPSLTAGRGHRGRQRVQVAFEEYFRKKGQLEGSSLVKVRCDVAERYNLSLEDMARFETTMAIGIFGTTAPSCFWMVYFLFSRPHLVDQLRAEMQSAITTTLGPDNVTPHRVLSTQAIKSSPLVSAIWNEVLRRSACGTSARLVEQDCIVPTQAGGKISLKRGSVIQMPSRILHTDSQLWGETVDAFDPTRFLTGKKITTGAFRPFGGGNTLCPGRHLAAAEINATAVMMALRFDISSAEGQKWPEPEMFATSVAAAIYSPREDIPVVIKRRKGFETGTWAFSQ